MRSTIAQRQLYIYVGYIFLVVLLSLFTYRFTQQKWLLYREAETYFYEKSFEEAIPTYQSSLQQGFTSPRLYVHLADSYTATGNFPEAIHFYKKYLDFYPQDKAVRLLLARALSWNGDLNESKKEYKKILEKSNEI